MTLSKCLVLVSDEAYIPHTKSVLVNAKRQGQWDGDYCVVLPSSYDHGYFNRRGILTLANDQPRHYRKYALFSDYFKKFGVVMYLDADVVIQEALFPVLDEVEWGTVLCDREPFDLMHAFTYWASPESLKTDEALDIFRWLWKRYDPTYFQFTTAMMAWHPRTLPPLLEFEMRTMHERIAPINTHVTVGTEQIVANLVLYGHFRQVRNRMMCYWEVEGPETKIMHTCSGLAPWIKKTPGAGAWYVPKLNRPMHDLYLDNLNAFETEFPIR